MTTDNNSKAIFGVPQNAPTFFGVPLQISDVERQNMLDLGLLDPTEDEKEAERQKYLAEKEAVLKSRNGRITSTDLYWIMADAAETFDRKLMWTPQSPTGWTIRDVFQAMGVNGFDLDDWLSQEFENLKSLNNIPKALSDAEVGFLLGKLDHFFHIQGGASGNHCSPDEYYEWVGQIMAGHYGWAHYPDYHAADIAKRREEFKLLPKNEQDFFIAAYGTDYI